jgi:hypothetical protein
MYWFGVGVNIEIIDRKSIEFRKGVNGLERGFVGGKRKNKKIGEKLKEFN